MNILAILTAAHWQWGDAIMDLTDERLNIFRHETLLERWRIVEFGFFTISGMCE